MTVESLLQGFLDAYDALDMPVRRYVLVAIAPSVVLFVASVVLGTTLDLPVFVRLLFPALGLLGVAGAVAYPRVRVNQRKVEMENKFHLVITHMTVLSTTNIDRMEVFRRLAGESEYGAFAAEIGRITQLVDTWNQSLDDACRRRAKRIRSDPIADFFERLAHSLGAGQALSAFLLNEQSVMIQNYVTVYEGALDNLEVMKDLYLSMILSMTFALVFATVLPVLTGTDPTLTVASVIILFGFVQVGFYLAIRTIAPYDPVWFHPDEVDPPTQRKTRLATAAGGALSVLLILLAAGGRTGVFPVGLSTFLFFLDPVPQPLLVAIPITPLLLPGIVLRNEETRIKARDDSFPSFIRTLGASESAKQSTTSAVLSDLRRKDFGPLTENVDNLYKRLNMRIDAGRAWDHFAAETRSYLIQKFGEMYLAGRSMGGEPRQLGELISENMNEVIQLRTRRKQATITLIGLLYGITAAAAFAFFIGMEVVTILSEMSLDIDSTGQFDFTQLIHTDVYRIPLITYLLLLVILFNALLSSLMIRAVDGGHKANAYIHFVLLTWIGCLVAIVTEWMVGNFLGV